MLSYNLINSKTKVTPSYDLKGRETSICLSFSKNKEVLIIGKVDNNYIYWASFSKIYDKEKNEAIFNHIANNPYDLVSNEYTVLKSVSFAYDDLKLWYNTELVRTTSDYNMAWKTPFGHYYGKDQVQFNGKYFSNDVAGFLDILLERCRFREANGSYEEVLDYSLNELMKNDKDVLYYTKVKSLIEMLIKEDYLVMSDHEHIRRKYILFRETADKLYNRYQSAIR
jgi:hypothetical protein